jgi:hypothetical protein
MQLGDPAEAFRERKDLVLITERVDDVALLIGQMVKMGFVEVLDRHIPRHWQQHGLRDDGRLDCPGAEASRER